MKKNINTVIEETLNSLDHIQPVNAPENLHKNILHRMELKKVTKEVYLFRNPQWLIAALVIGIICNVYFAISYTNKTSFDNGTETSNVSSFVNHFQLGSSSIY